MRDNFIAQDTLAIAFGGSRLTKSEQPEIAGSSRKHRVLYDQMLPFYSSYSVEYYLLTTPLLRLLHYT